MAPARSVSILLWALALKAGAVLALQAAAATQPATPGFTSARQAHTPEWVWYLARGFDSHAYQRMAHEGWYDDFTVGLPLGYPLAIRALLPLTGSAQTAAVLISNVCSFGALLVFLALARRYAGASAERVGPAVLLCACFPGVLAFGTVAYSEGPWILVTLLSWWAYLRAESTGRATRSPRWLILSALLAALSVQLRHAGIAFVGGLLLLEAWRVFAASGGAPRRRALLEAGLFVALAAIPTAAYFVFKFQVQDMGAAERALFDTRLVPLGGLPALLASGVPPENVALLALTLPLAFALYLRLWGVDRRLALVTGCQLLLALSVTGIAAQSLNRLVWALAPLALGALAISDRVLLAGMAGTLFLASLWCGIGHVLGTAAL